MIYNPVTNTQNLTEQICRKIIFLALLSSVLPKSIIRDIAGNIYECLPSVKEKGQGIIKAERGKKEELEPQQH